VKNKNYIILSSDLKACQVVSLDRPFTSFRLLKHQLQQPNVTVGSYFSQLILPPGHPTGWYLHTPLEVWMLLLIRKLGVTGSFLGPLQMNVCS